MADEWLLCLLWHFCWNSLYFDKFSVFFFIFIRTFIFFFKALFGVKRLFLKWMFGKSVYVPYFCEKAIYRWDIGMWEFLFNTSISLKNPISAWLDGWINVLKNIICIHYIFFISEWVQFLLFYASEVWFWWVLVERRHRISHPFVGRSDWSQVLLFILAHRNFLFRFLH